MKKLSLWGWVVFLGACFSLVDGKSQSWASETVSPEGVKAEVELSSSSVPIKNPFMSQRFQKILAGYAQFRAKYAEGNLSPMQTLSEKGQSPEVMVIACSDSRVDPALILQCDPGDLFVVRNVANIVPPYECDQRHHGTSAALEFGICHLKVKHLILLGHSQCGGIQTLLSKEPLPQTDFIQSWISTVRMPEALHHSADTYAQLALHRSYENCLAFPWIKSALEAGQLVLHRWFFQVRTGQIFAYQAVQDQFVPLESLYENSVLGL